MAASGGKKKKQQWRQISVEKVLDSPPKFNWADEVEQLDSGDYVKRNSVVLPTAPRASRGTVVDESKVPTAGPFQAYLSNIPYDMNEDELAQVFDHLRIKSVKLPKDDRGGTRATKGFGYIEFEDRSNLISALNQGETIVKGRAIRIELATNVDSSGRGGNRGGPRGGRSDGIRESVGPDRTSGNWRSDTRPSDDDRYDRDRGGRYDGGGGGGGSGRRDYNYGRNYEREDRGFGREERGGSYSRNERGFSRDYDDRERDQRFSREERTQDRYGSRDGGFSDRDRDRGGGGGGFRDKGFRDDREDRGRYGRDERYGREERGERGGGFGGGRFEDRKEERYGPRRDTRGDSAPKGEPAPEAAKDRPKLVLQPRTRPRDTQPAPAVSSSIFGGAKPVDTAARDREIEEKLIRKDDTFETNRSGSRGSQPPTARRKDWSDEKRIEPAPPPKDNAWSQRASNQPVNNGRVSPYENSEERSRYGDDASGGDDDDKHSDDQSSKGGDGTQRGSSSEKSRGEKQSKSREVRRDSTDDIAKMPKVQDSPAPNFAGENKFSSLVADDA